MRILSMAVNSSYANPNNEYLGGGGPWLTPKQLFLTNGPVNSQLIKLPEFQAASRQGKKKMIVLPLHNVVGEKIFDCNSLP